jgi:antitoxin CcdA
MRMSRAAKRPINLSLDADLIEAARAHGLNLSAITEDALRKRIAEEDAQRWLAENSEAITAQNAWTAEHGLLSDEFRGW